jgi:hypothetical protein
MRATLLLFLLILATDLKAQLRVESTSPPLYGTLAVDNTLTVTFSETVDPVSLEGAIRVFGVQSGTIPISTGLSAPPQMPGCFLELSTLAPNTEGY